MNKIIYICGQGDFKSEIKTELYKGNIPYVPAKVFDGVRGTGLERAALEARIIMLKLADEVLVVGSEDLAITKKEIWKAKQYGIPIRYRLDPAKRLYNVLFNTN